MKLRTIYLQSLLSVNGRDSLLGRVLFDRLKEVSEDCLLGHMIVSDEDAERVRNNPDLCRDKIDHRLMRDFSPNFVYVEGGLFSGKDGTRKIPADFMMEVCRAGGVCVVADVDTNELRWKKKQYLEIYEQFRALAKYSQRDETEPLNAADEQSCWAGGEKQILCKPTQMIIDDWVKPIYEGIPEILVSLPAVLQTDHVHIASGNEGTTRVLDLDFWSDHYNACVFGAATQLGSGFAVLIAGRVSADIWLEGCEHNTQWLQNLGEFLVAEGGREYARRLSHHRSQNLLFLSHRSVDKPTIERIARAIKRGGQAVWFDQEQLVPSQSLVSEIDQALSQMTHFVLFWSASCLEAPWVKKELNASVALMIKKSIPMIIVRLDQTPVPAIVSDLLRIEGLGEEPELLGQRIVETVERLSKL